MTWAPTRSDVDFWRILAEDRLRVIAYIRRELAELRLEADIDVLSQDGIRRRLARLELEASPLRRQTVDGQLSLELSFLPGRACPKCLEHQPLGWQLRRPLLAWQFVRCPKCGFELTYEIELCGQRLPGRLGRCGARLPCPVH